MHASGSKCEARASFPTRLSSHAPHLVRKKIDNMVQEWFGEAWVWCGFAEWSTGGRALLGVWREGGGAVAPTRLK